MIFHSVIPLWRHAELQLKPFLCHSPVNDLIYKKSAVTSTTDFELYLQKAAALSIWSILTNLTASFYQYRFLHKRTGRHSSQQNFAFEQWRPVLPKLFQ